MINRFSGNYRFLSNFYESEIEVDGIVYPTLEHAFQAYKSHDLKDRLMIRDLRTAGEAKTAGQLVNRRENWDDIRTAVMYRLVRIKFSSEPLKTRLIETAPHELVEGNTWNDTFWGVCRGKGENWLGKILMLVRDELMESTTT